METVQDRQRINLYSSVDTIRSIDKSTSGTLDNRVVKRGLMLGAVALVSFGATTCAPRESETPIDNASSSIDLGQNLVADSFIRPEPVESVDMDMVDALYKVEEPKPVESKPEEKEKPRPDEPEKPKEISNAEAAKIFSESDHKYANCGHIVAGFLKDGYSYEQALGAAGNSAVESWDSQAKNGCNPDKRQDNGGPGMGIFQWTDSVRWQDLLRWANKNGLSEYDIDTQIGFALHELDTTEDAAKNALKGTDTPEEATDIFCRRFERPDMSAAHMDRRKKATEAIYNELQSIKQG